MPPPDWVERIQCWARTEAQIKEIWVFGSYARGEQKAGSDLDLAVMLFAESSAKLLVWMNNASRWRQSLGLILHEVVLQIEPGDDELSDEVVSPAVRKEGVRIFQQVAN